MYRDGQGERTWDSAAQKEAEISREVPRSQLLWAQQGGDADNKNLTFVGTLQFTKHLNVWLLP